MLLPPLNGLEFAFLAVVVITLFIHRLAASMRGGMLNGYPVDLQAKSRSSPERDALLDPEVCRRGDKDNM